MFGSSFGVRRRGALALVGLTACVGLVACTTQEGAGQGSAGAQSLSIALPFKPVASLSPFSDDSVLNTRLGIAETLVALDSSGLPTPWLAEKFETPDARTVVFSLREGAKFHDGSPVTAEAVVNSLQHAWDADVRPKGLGKKQLTFEAADERTVKVTSEVDDPVLVQRFADPGTVILAAGAYTGDAPNPVGFGTGPFVATLADATDVTSERFADYWGDKAQVNEVHARFLQDGATRANAVRAGEVMMAQAVPIAQLASVGTDELESTPLPRGVYLHLNAKKGVFADASLRAAAAAAVKPDEIVASIYEGHAAKAQGSLFSADAEWNKGVTSANSTADKAAVTGQKVTIATWTERPELGEVASAIAAQLKEAGFVVEVKAADYKSMEQALLDGEFDAVVGSRNYQSGAADPVGFLASDYTCDGSYNLSQLCDPEIDAKVAKAQEITDLQERFHTAAEIGADVVATNAVVPLAHEYSINVVAGVKDLYFDPFERRLVTNETTLK